MSSAQTNDEPVAVLLANRGQNLLATSILGLGGLVFGSVVFQEHDLSDKVDDAGFLAIAIAMVAWYLWPGNWLRRSAVPLLVAGLAVAVQVLGLVLERDDPKAFGDNIGGMAFFGAGLVLIGFQHWRTTSIIDRLSHAEETI